VCFAGLTVILGGKVVKPLLERLGTKRFVDLGNWSSFLVRYEAHLDSLSGPLSDCIWLHLTGLWLDLTGL